MANDRFDSYTVYQIRRKPVIPVAERYADRVSESEGSSETYWVRSSEAEQLAFNQLAEISKFSGPTNQWQVELEPSIFHEDRNLPPFSIATWCSVSTRRSERLS